MTAPCTWFTALLGLMIWLPMSPATQTLLTFSFVVGADA